MIPGWQVSGDTSRKFYFTGEKRSYGAALGQTANLGTIEAVFFREKQPYRTGVWGGRKEEKISSNEKRGRLDARGRGALAPRPPAEQALRPSSGSRPSPRNLSSSSLSDELAATGIGRRTRFDVTRVDVDLEDAPAMSVRLRYEFRPQLVALGVLRESPDPVARREAGRGFSDFCPEPN